MPDTPLPSRSWRPLALLLLVAGAAPDRSHAQQPPTAAPAAPLRIAGVVRSTGGAAVAGANVFVFGALDGAVSDSVGAFAFMTDAAAGALLVVRRIGYAELRHPVPGPDSALVLVLEPVRPTLTPITVMAGRHTADAERGATLTPLQVATTPGATADVNRAIQTLPGVQSVDEGTALFVRGGDFTETRTVLNGAAILTPPQLLTPTGTYSATVDPFQLEGIFFSSGGFGARYGNALSGIVDLTTQGRPATRNAQVGLGLAAASVSVGAPLGANGGAWMAANRFDVAPLLAVNGAPRDYRPPPRGHEVAGSATWRYRPLGELRAYAIDSRTRLGVQVDEPGFSGTYAADVGGALAVLSARDATGPLVTTASASAQRLTRMEDFGGFRLALAQRVAHASLGAALEAHPRVLLRGGAELERTWSGLAGSIPAPGASAAPEARRRVLDGDQRGRRDALFAEADWRVVEPVRVVLGARTDGSTLTGRRTVDPRLSAAWRARPTTTVTAAWGVYHQVPDALLFDSTLGVPGLPSMRARQSVLGLQLGEGARMLRVELFDKRYRDLALLATEPGRPRVGRGAGVGSARGLDLILKATGPWRLERRLTYSLVRAERTDAATGQLARAPMDVTHGLTSIVERAFTGGWRAGLAWRSATGRPFTPILGGVPGAAPDGWTPVWGAPMSERFPGYRRLDLSVSRARAFGPRTTGIFYASLNNLLDRRNVQAWRYSADYAERTPVRSIFARSVYVGATLQRR
jgi:hypothetical protein